MRSISDLRPRHLLRRQEDDPVRWARRSRETRPSNSMTKPAASVIVTGISGNLGKRRLPLLADFRVVGVDLAAPDSPLRVEFHALNLGHEASCRELTQLIRNAGARSVVHLAFVMDPRRVGPLDI